MQQAWTYVSDKTRAESATYAFMRSASAWVLVAMALVCALSLSMITFFPVTQALALEDNEVNPEQTPDSSFLYDTSIYELANADASLQGQRVQVVGEVVGDAIKSEEDPGKYWIMLSSTDPDKEAAISVLVDPSALQMIDSYGHYGQIGTILRVRGIFYLACPTHQGIVDIHSEYTQVVDKGQARPDEFHIQDFVPGIIVCIIGAALALLFRFLKERDR